MTQHPLHQSWCYVHLPQLQLDAWQRETTQLSPSLVIVCESRHVVMQANTHARECGIEPGMNIADAWLLSDELDYQFYCAESSQAGLLNFAARIYAHFADISVDEQGSGLWINLQTQLHLYPDQRAVEQRLAALLTGINFRLYFSSNPTLAKIGIDDRTTALSVAARGFPITHTDMDAQLQHKLTSMGLSTIDKVLAVPVEVLGKKLGQSVIAWYLAITGRSFPQMDAFHPRQCFYQYRQLNSEVSNWGGLRFVIKGLLQALQNHLIERQLAVQQITLVIFERGFQGNPAHPPSLDAAHVRFVDINMARPASKALDMFQVLQLRMETQRFSHPVTDVALQVASFEPLARTNAGFWATSSVNEHCSVLLNRLQAKLGSERVQRVAPQHAWLPELQQIHREVGADASLCVQPPRTWTPFWLVAAEPVDINQWQLSGQPQRMATPWWSVELTDHRMGSERDYWLAQDAIGRWGWLYFVPSQPNKDCKGAWFIQGWAS